MLHDSDEYEQREQALCAACRQTCEAAPMTKLFSYRDRPVHLGPYPLEKLARAESVALDDVPDMAQVSFRRPDDTLSIVNAMQDYQAMLDATRDGLVKKEIAEIPSGLTERANHLKAFGYYCDASMVGVCEVPREAWLRTPLTNPDVDRLADKLRTLQPKTLAAGIDVIMAGLRESMRAPPQSCDHHTHALVFLYDMPRDPKADEDGTEWIKGAQDSGDTGLLHPHTWLRRARAFHGRE